MFFDQPDKNKNMLDELPDELLLEIINQLPLKDAISFLSVSKDMNLFIKDDSVWRKFGANNFEDFVTRIKNLYKALQQPVLNEKYTLLFAEDIQKILNLPPEGRQKAMLSSDEIEKFRHNHLDVLSSDEGIISLKGKLITLEHINKMYIYKDLLKEILTPNGLIALREHLITPEQLHKFNVYPERLRSLLTNNGLIALREKLITLEQLRMIDLYARQLDVLLCDNGVIALREKLITLEQVYSPIYMDQLKILLSNNGISALREKLITIEQLGPFYPARLDILLSHNGFTALRENLITTQEILNVNLHSEHLNILLTDKGLTALREKLITLEELKDLRPKQIEELLSNKVNEFESKPASTPKR